jgi:hypothetical protein
MNFALGGRPTRVQINPVRPQAFSNPLRSVSSSAFQQAPSAIVTTDEIVGAIASLAGAEGAAGS